MRFSRRLLMTIPVLGLLTWPAFAQRGNFQGGPMDPWRMVLDENGDGELSRSEIANAAVVLRKVDQNKDGQLNRDELRQFMANAMRNRGFRTSVASPHGGGGPGSPGSATLERAGLKVGSPAPDVTVYDANGDKLSLNALRGSHAVLVFGCLT